MTSDSLHTLGRWTSEVGKRLLGSGHAPLALRADWQARQDVFVAMTATQSVGGFTVNESGVPRDLPTLQVTAGYFDVYRAYPQVGRVFTRQHEMEGSERVAQE